MGHISTNVDSLARNAIDDLGVELITGKIQVGDVGTEGSGINIGGVIYESSLKVSDINGTNFAQSIFHRHSTTIEPLQLGARSNSDTDAHSDVTNGMGLFSTFAAGTAGTSYKLFGLSQFAVDDTGSVSNTSAPGKWTLSLTPDGSVTPAAVITARNDKSVTFAGQISTLGKSAFSATLSATLSNFTGDGTAVTIIFNNEIFDQAGNYNNATGVFTAPVAGKYRADVSCDCYGFLAGHTSFIMNIVTSNRIYVKYAPAGNTGMTESSIGLSPLVDMDAGDTAYITVAVYGGTKVVDMLGSTSSSSYFSMEKVC